MKAKYETLLMKTQENTNQWPEYFRDVRFDSRKHTDCRDEPVTEGPLHEVTCEDVERQLRKKKNG